MTQIARFAISGLNLLTIVDPTVFRSARSRLRQKSFKNAAWFASDLSNRPSFSSWSQL